jgi:hypothetical protein
MIVDNLPKGVIAELYRQAHGPVRSLQVRLVNFTGGWPQEGVLPVRVERTYPDLLKKLPDPTRPIRIGIRAKDVQKVVLFSPDYDNVVDLPIERDGEYVFTQLPIFHRVADICFVQDGVPRILDLAGGPTVSEIPAPKPLVYEEERRIVGNYDPNAVVVFADSERMTGGRYITVWCGEISRTAYGENSSAREITATFDLAQVPRSATFDLGGLNGEGHPEIPLQIELNGQMIHDGRSPFPAGKWGVLSIPLKPGQLHAGRNTVIVRNGDQVKEGSGIATFRIKWFSINFVRIRPK